MIVKAKDLKVGDRIGSQTIFRTDRFSNDGCVYVIFEGHQRATHHKDTEIAIHREPMIKKRDGPFEPFSKEKLKRSIYKAVLDLPEEEWDFSGVQSIVDDVCELCPKTTTSLRLHVNDRLLREHYESYNK
jgi:hypothetical protein